jgi:hypothetical protein
MLYSNEVYLVNSSYGRVVDSDVLTLNEIDVESSLLEFNDRIHKDRVEGFRSRIFKLIDVALVYKHNDLNLLLERYDGLKVICRVSDVLFTDTRLVTITYNDGYNVIVPRVDGSDSTYINFCVDEYDVASSLEGNSNDTTISNTIFDLLRTANITKGFVDKADTREFEFRNRFFLDTDSLGSVMAYLDNCDIQTNRISYSSCHFCETTVTSGKNTSIKDCGEVYVCNPCYTTVEVTCDCCYTTIKLANRINTKTANGYASKVFQENEIDRVCSDCYELAINFCSRCRCVDMIDIDELRGVEFQKTYLLNYYNDAKYRTIFSKRYCPSCADMTLNTYLTTPFNYRPLPREFTTKSDYSRFVGIESEVITESSSASDYVDEDKAIPKFFNVVEDGSLNEGGVEFVTTMPIIGDNVNIALDSLQEVNEDEWNTVDSSCGLHIHMNALDMGFVEIKSLLMIMSRIQYKLYESIPECRRDTSYAKEIDLSPLAISRIGSLSELVDSYYSMAETRISDQKYNDARYIGTNIHSRFYLGSIEFRYHEGVASSKPIKDWILFLNSIMTASKDLSSRPKLYSKIVNSKFQPIDIIREICGVSGADYIESKIDNNK